MRLSSFFTTSSVSSALLVASLVSSASAQDRTTEAGEAAISNGTAECVPYWYPPVSDVAYNFPTNWQPAFILANDTAANAKYNSIASQIPNIAPKGTQPASLEGNFSNYSYPSSDPDCWWTYDQCTTPKLAGLQPDMTGAPEPDTLGYGFDDGPNCSHNAFYDYLQENNQKATMFYIGSNVMNWPLEAQRALADGHEICVHTWSHRYMTSLTNEQVFAEFYYTMQMIKLVVGVTPTCWRPPFGDVDDRVRWIANALGLKTIVWQYDSNDWKAGIDGITDQDVDDNYMNLIARAQNGTFSTGGTIMLTHELNNFTMSEAVKFYDQLKSAFKYLVPMGVANNQTQPYVETNYSLPTFEAYISGTTVVTGGTPQTSTSGSSGSASSGSSSTLGSNGGSTDKPSSGAVGQQVFSKMGALAATAAFLGGVARVLA